MYKRVKNIKNEKMFYIFDLIALSLFLAVIITVIVFQVKPKGTNVEIYVSGQKEYVYQLDKDRTIKIENNGHINIVEIKNGKVKMMVSDCKNQLCVHNGEISMIGQQIVCLPNQIIVVITGKGGELDATT